MSSRIILFFGIFTFFGLRSLFAQVPNVVINEIMYAPKTGAPEWFELLNIDTQAINIKGWRMSDATQSRTVITNNDYLIQPNAFVVIAKDSSILSEYPEVAGSLIVANVPSLNNTGDDVAIYLPDTTLIEKISYLPSWGGNNSKSLERKSAASSGNSASNWGTSIDSKGATPERKNSLAALNYDLTIQSIIFIPSLPRIGENITASVEVMNKGVQDAFPFSIQCFDDVDQNDIPDPSELLFTNTASSPLTTGQTQKFDIAISSNQSAKRNFIFLIQFANDENVSNNRRNESVVYGVTQGSIVINEIMYAPSSGEPEWIELFNTTDQPVSMKDWEIADNSNRVTITETDSMMQPKSYVIISKNNSIANYHSTISSPIIIANLPTLNNDGDEVRLFDSHGYRIDSVRYYPEWGGAVNGHSLEKIDPSANSNDKNNWSTSTDSERSTPGRKNSVAILDYDAAIYSIRSVSSDVRVVVTNVGTQTLVNLSVSLYHDLNNDSIATENERIAAPRNIISIPEKDSVDVVFAHADSIAGTHTFIARVDAAQDQRLSNNTLVSKIISGFEKGALVINEIMFAPNVDEAEYLEYVNMSNREMNIQDWKILGATTSSGRESISISTQPFFISPKSFFVIASDSSIFKRFDFLKTPQVDRVIKTLNRTSLNLNNDFDEIVLVDPAGNTIDSIHYESKWHNPNFISTTGISLEKINPTLSAYDSRNWSSSTTKLGGTPGLRNSIYTELPSSSIQDGGVSITFTPNPFSPDGDGFEDFTLIKWHLPAVISQIRIRVFDTQGRLVGTIANNIPSGNTGELIWNGLDNDKQRLRIGMYVVLLEGMDINNNVVNAAKGVVVIASKL